MKELRYLIFSVFNYFQLKGIGSNGGKQGKIYKAEAKGSERAGITRAAGIHLIQPGGSIEAAGMGKKKGHSTDIYPEVPATHI